MKWLMHGAGLLVSAVIITALRTFGLDAAFGGIGTAAVSVLVFFFGVYFFPRLIIRRIEARRAAAPVPEAPPSPALSVDELPSVESDVEPKRKPIRPCVSGYQLAVAILLFFSIFFAIKYFSASGHADELSAASEARYHEGYEAGYQDAGDTSYESGYEEGRQHGVAEGYNLLYEEASFFRENACFVTLGGNCYHHYGCPHISGSEYWIYNVELAESKGYTPCLDCWKSGLHLIEMPVE